MESKAQTPPPAVRRAPSHPIYLKEGLGTKKTALIILTVIGCIAILWPKVFYPMMFGGTPAKANVKDPRAAPGGCCDVVFQQEQYANATPFGPHLQHRQLNLYTSELSIRQERPTHLHPESIYMAMRERGRAIPTPPTIPIVDRKGSPSNPPPRIVEGRPGPIPGMRPPMGAGSHQPQTKGNSMGFIMPLYTIGIIVFFGYTIMKIVFKKPVPNAPYGPPPPDANFRKDVFGHENGRHVEEMNGSKLGWREHQTRPNLHVGDNKNANELYNASLSATTAATNLSSNLKQHRHQGLPPLQQAMDTSQLAKTPPPNRETEQLMEIEKLRKKLEDTERAMAKLINEMNSDQYDAKNTNENSSSNNVETPPEHTTEHDDTIRSTGAKEGEKDSSRTERKHQQLDSGKRQLKKRRSARGNSSERTVSVLGMEATASCEGGQKWKGRPPTPVFGSHHDSSATDDEEMPEPYSIYLEGSLAHDSQILVSDSENRAEEVYDDELNGSADEPAVVVSSKMTLSLINLDSNADNNEIESPLADDIEIIGDDEQHLE